MTMTATDLDLSTLMENGDTLTLEDGRVLRLKIEPDYDASINDFDCYGQVWENSLPRNEMGYYTRPSTFTGNAEKLSWGNDGPWWWEPPTDVSRSDEMFRSLRDSVIQLLAYGFSGVMLELCKGNDYYGKLIVVNSVSLWGVDDATGGAIVDILADLADELGVTN